MYNVTIIDRGPSQVVIPFNPLWSQFLLLFTIVDTAYVVECHEYY